LKDINDFFTNAEERPKYLWDQFVNDENFSEYDELYGYCKMIINYNDAFVTCDTAAFTIGVDRNQLRGACFAGLVPFIPVFPTHESIPDTITEEELKDKMLQMYRCDPYLYKADADKIAHIKQQLISIFPIYDFANLIQNQESLSEEITFVGDGTKFSLKLPERLVTEKDVEGKIVLYFRITKRHRTDTKGVKRYGWYAVNSFRHNGQSKNLEIFISKLGQFKEEEAAEKIIKFFVKHYEKHYKPFYQVTKKRLPQVESRYQKNKYLSTGKW
jgi:hypothetical protein